MPRSTLRLRSLAAIELPQIAHHGCQRTLEQWAVVQGVQDALLERQG